MGNRLKTIDFIGDFELPGSKKRLIPSHNTKNVKNAQFSRVFVEFLWDDCEKIKKVFA
jgi:hypothetical protein